MLSHRQQSPATRVVLWLGVWLLGGWGNAQAPEERLSVMVPIWVDQLDAPESRARREAELKLIEAGPEAAPFVPPVLEHLSIDARERLKRVEQRWAGRKTKQETSDAVVRLAGKTTVGEALEAISAASGVEFEYEGEMNAPVQSPALPLGFWHAVDLVLDQTGLDINFYGGDRNTLLLVPRGEERPSRVDSAAYAGIYRLEPTIVTARRVLGSPQLSSLNVTLSIAWQPNRTPIGLSVPLAELSGRLDNQETLSPQESGESIDIATSSELAQTEFYLPMRLPEGTPTKIETVAGSIKALLPGNRASFELTLTDPAARSQQDAMTVVLEQVRAIDPLHEVRVGVSLNNADRSLESHRQWIYENDAYVRLADGTRLNHLGYEVFRQTGSGIGIGYLFDLGGVAIPEGSVLVYESPTSVIASEVGFVLNDIRLP